MSNVIKATDPKTTRHGTAFNLDDLAAKANDYLARVKVEAGKIVTEARQEAEKAQKDAETVRRHAEERARQQEEEAKKQGFEEGRKAAEQEVKKEFEQRVKQEAKQQLQEKIATLMPALKESVTFISESKHAWYGLWEEAALEVMKALAKRVIRREIQADPAISITWIREALELAAGSPKLQIFLHPEDHQTLLPEVEMLVKELAGVAATEVLADPTISRGGCRVETPFGLIDQQIESQLDRLSEELL